MEENDSKNEEKETETLEKNLVKDEEIQSISINFFNLNKELLGEELVEDIMSKNPYTNLEEVQGVLSHLSYLDATQNQKNILLGKVENKPLNFEIELNNKDNQQVAKYTFDNINLGEGNFTKGVEHLLSVGMVEQRSTLLQKLDKHLRIPNGLKVESLEKLGHSTSKTLQSIAQSQVLEEDLSAFMDSFLKNLLNQDEKKKQEQGFTKEQQEMFATVKEFASQKKSKGKEYELSNNKSIGVGR